MYDHDQFGDDGHAKLWQLQRMRFPRRQADRRLGTLSRAVPVRGIEVGAAHAGGGMYHIFIIYHDEKKMIVYRAGLALRSA